jgi:hypothetical protein
MPMPAHCFPKIDSPCRRKSRKQTVSAEITIEIQSICFIRDFRFECRSFDGRISQLLNGIRDYEIEASLENESKMRNFEDFENRLTNGED